MMIWLDRSLKNVWLTEKTRTYIVRKEALEEEAYLCGQIHPETLSHPAAHPGPLGSIGNFAYCDSITDTTILLI